MSCNIDKPNTKGGDFSEVERIVGNIKDIKIPVKPEESILCKINNK